MRSRLLGAAALAIGVAVTLTACGGGSVTGNSGGSDGKTQITVWHNYTGAQAKEAKKLIDEFNDSQDDIQVTAQYAAQSDQFDAKLINALKNDTGPNMVLGDSTPQKIGQVVETGKVVPLDDYLSDSESDITTDSFTEGKLATGKFEDKTYTLPTDIGDYAVVYNKEMFKEAGITDTPTTWAELQEDAKKLTKGTTQYGMYLPIGTGEWPVFTYQSMLWSAGGEFLNEDNTKVEFNSDAGVEALTAWTDMLKDGSAYPQSLMTSTSNGGTPALTAKKAAMAITGAYDLGTLDEALGKDNVGVFALPGIQENAMNLGTNNSYLLDGTKAEKDASWDFMQWWLSPEVEAKWDIATGLLPANTATNDNATWKKYLKDNPRLEAFADEISYAKSRPSIVAYGEVSEALSKELEKAMLLKESPKDALATAAKNAQSVLDSAD
ncbi:ABC transporter substrate-binding protein [Curtobacterium pusillum]|uniref:ABC transporter substrate-binding protein n=1 Tax=Curtobacterium pusillum TaxID=69373 RepID=A0ABX2MHQ1_9MICO|nr:ABC transporter substrate-binding protein [Curtobacterium pusillum]NUU15487.1 ABC transporter substrate-binding protein [Curtobacterium pusillum]GLK32794.1 ABC transporter substrate-binding protein [Curtobacterium pusillum]